jgi:deoxyribodipyrimidine photo-lyase
MSSGASIVWFRLDLRVVDQPALLAAVDRGAPIIPVYIDSSAEEGTAAPGAAARWWLHHALVRLDEELRQRGSRLIVRQGNTADELLRLAKDCSAAAIFWNRRYEPAVIARDQLLKASLQAAGLVAQSCNAALLFEPWEVATKQDKPFQVFTPFSKACLAKGNVSRELPAPHRILAPNEFPTSLPLVELRLLPSLQWDSGFYETWLPDAQSAEQVLTRFVERGLAAYQDRRNLPAADAGTSTLSPYLHFGQVSPRQVWHAVSEADLPGESSAVFKSEILWREFAYHLLFHFPHTETQPLRAPFEKFPWRNDKRALLAWQRGETGYPLVDAGMRQLWATGWMHNRVRMVVASFLCKHLLLDWRQGAAWFWDTLVDADLASNTLGWQWTAGCGADAAPYFRIFNPTAQGQRFDPLGDYIRRWVPELKSLDGEAIHSPSTAMPLELARAGIVLGKTYPKPMVEHSQARDRALAAYRTIAKKSDV